MQFVVQKPVAESGALCDFEFLAVRLRVVIVIVSPERQCLDVENYK